MQSLTKSLSFFLQVLHTSLRACDAGLQTGPEHVPLHHHPRARHQGTGGSLPRARQAPGTVRPEGDAGALRQWHGHGFREISSKAVRNFKDVGVKSRFMLKDDVKHRPQGGELFDAKLGACLVIVLILQGPSAIELCNVSDLYLIFDK